jgi:hypothetical protein
MNQGMPTEQCESGREKVQRFHCLTASFNCSRLYHYSMNSTFNRSAAVCNICIALEFPVYRVTSTESRLLIQMPESDHLWVADAI